MSYVFKERNPPEKWHEFKARAKHPWLVPLYYATWLVDWAAFFMSVWPLVELLEYLGSFSILFAAIFYFAGSSNRVKQRHYQAWAVINTAQGKGGSGGRVDAMEDLNNDGISLIGVDVKGVYLQDVHLEKARLRRAELSESDLRNADLRMAGLQDAMISNANLRYCDLRGCDFSGATLDDTDFVRADLSGANLDGVTLNRADFCHANLDHITNWQSIQAVGQLNIYGVLNPPPGFVAWALKKGAIETNSE